MEPKGKYPAVLHFVTPFFSFFRHSRQIPLSSKYLPCIFPHPSVSSGTSIPSKAGQEKSWICLHLMQTMWWCLDVLGSYRVLSSRCCTLAITPLRSKRAKARYTVSKEIGGILGFTLLYTSSAEGWSFAIASSRSISSRWCVSFTPKPLQSCSAILNLSRSELLSIICGKLGKFLGRNISYLALPYQDPMLFFYYSRLKPVEVRMNVFIAGSQSTRLRAR